MHGMDGGPPRSARRALALITTPRRRGDALAQPMDEPLQSWLARLGLGEDIAGAFYGAGLERLSDLHYLNGHGLSESDLRELLPGVNMKSRKIVRGELQLLSASRNVTDDRVNGKLSFAEHLWDSFQAVASDVRMQNQQFAVLARHLTSRWQLEQEYSDRLRSLGDQLSVPRSGAVLLRPYEHFVRVIQRQGETLANHSAERAVVFKDRCTTQLNGISERRTVTIDRMSSEAARLKLQLQQAYVDLERARSEHMKAEHHSRQPVKRLDSKSSGGAAAPEQFTAVQ
jgi:hypothetical protein